MSDKPFSVTPRYGVTKTYKTLAAAKKMVVDNLKQHNDDFASRYAPEDITRIDDFIRSVEGIEEADLDYGPYVAADIIDSHTQTTLAYEFRKEAA
jgi:hypothetical protein